MSELKVNEITGLGGTVKINDPVGLGAVARSGYQLNSNGKVNVEGSVEVVTVPASNFGVRIRAPINSTTSPGFGDSTLQFTNNQGTTEWASIHAKSDASLEIRTDNDPALTINNSQVINHLGASLFTNTATFNNSMQVNGQATFAASVIPQCGGVPTTTTHLTNKAYVDTKFLPQLSTIKAWSSWPNQLYSYAGCNVYANNSGAFSEVLTGTWIVIAWTWTMSGCSRDDNESFYCYPNSSRTWTITNNSVAATVGSIYQTTTPNAAGICIKVS